LQEYQERPYNWRPRKLSSLRMLSCSCSSRWPFKYKRSNVNKQTWTLIVLSDTPFLALVLRICIQITGFQISSTLPHYLQHLSSPTNTWGLLHEIAMSKHLPPSEDRTWRPNLFPDKGTPYCPKNWHDPGWASLITWCLSVCLSVSFKIIDKIQKKPNLGWHPRIQKLCWCVSEHSPGMAKFCSFHDHKLPPHNPKQTMSHLVSWICTQPQNTRMRSTADLEKD
jgi:hypothetical protein